MIHYNMIHFIIIFLILSLIYSVFILSKIKIKESFEQKCLIVLYGESFREGNQHTRLRDTDTSYTNQMNACDSHIKFIEMLKNKYNITSDVCISTYKTKYENELKEKYKNVSLIYKSEDNLIGYNEIAKKGYENIDLTNYKFILLTRNDILFKDEFINNFKEYDKIMYVSQGSASFHDCYLDGSPVVNPCIIIVPNTYFNIMNDINVDHNSWKVLYELHNYNKDHMGFMLNTYHDADSYKDWNPYYKMVSREESQTFLDEGKENVYLTKKECYIKR